MTRTGRHEALPTTARRLAAACAVASLLLPAAPAAAKLGDLDTGFDGDGVVTLTPGSELRAAVPLPGGAVAVGGSIGVGNRDFFVAELTAAGAPVTQFGGGAVTWTGSENSQVYDLALAPNGDLAVAGAFSPGALDGNPLPELARITPAGVRSSLPLSGASLPPVASFTAVAPATDGSGDFVIAGWGKVSSTDTTVQLLVGRVNADGSEDAGFGGYHLVNLGSPARAADVEVDALGRVTVVGVATTPSAGVPVPKAAAMRFTASGGRDASFNTSGQLVIAYQAPFGGASQFLGAELRGSGFLATGTLAGETSGMIQAVTATGGFDAAYGTNGSPEGATSWTGTGQGIAQTSTGGSVVAGHAGTALQTAWLTSSGQPDPRAGGIRTHAVAIDAGANPLGVAVGSGDALTVAGTDGDHGVVARFAPNAAPVVSLAVPAQVQAGAPVTIDAAGTTDPEGEPLTYAFDLDGDGTYEFAGGDNPLALRSYTTPGTYTVGVQATDPHGASATATRSVAVLPAIQPVPLPILHKQGVARPLKGKVRYRLPGTKAFLPMVDLTAIPNGTEIDVRKGRVLLTVLHDASGRLDGAKFYAGRFIFNQGKGAVPVTSLRLKGGTYEGCPKPGKAAKVSVRTLAMVASQARDAGSTVRRLWGNGRGKFRTRGRYGAATVRGTKWLTRDQCNGTLVKVERGKVDVEDLLRPKRRPVRVTAGEKVLIKAKRRG